MNSAPALTPALTAAIASALAMTAIVAVRYGLASGGFALATAKVRPGLYRGLDRQIRAEIGWSLKLVRVGLSGLPHHQKPARSGFGEGWSIYPPHLIGAPGGAMGGSVRGIAGS